MTADPRVTVSPPCPVLAGRPLPCETSAHFIIYGLKDPLTDVIMYVGKSSSGLKRPRYHAHAARKGDGGLCANWIRGLLDLELMYEIVVLEYVVDASVLVDREVWWIACGRNNGWPLLNQTIGGEGLPGFKHYKLTKSKLRDAALRQWSNPNSRKRITESMIGRTVSPLGRARLSVAHLGVRLTPEHRARIAVGNLGHAVTPETSAKISRALKGRNVVYGSDGRRSIAAVGQRI